MSLVNLKKKFTGLQKRMKSNSGQFILCQKSKNISTSFAKNYKFHRQYRSLSTIIHDISLPSRFKPFAWCHFWCHLIYHPAMLSYSIHTIIVLMTSFKPSEISKIMKNQTYHLMTKSLLKMYHLNTFINIAHLSNFQNGCRRTRKIQVENQMPSCFIVFIKIFFLNQ